MGIGAHVGARDPHRCAVARRDQAVTGHRHLQLHERAAPGHAQDVARRHPARLLPAQADVDRHSGLEQDRHAAAGDLRIGILRGHHDAAHAGGEDRLGAGHRLAYHGIGAPVVGAGLQGHVHGPAARKLAGPRQGMRLRVRAPADLRPPPGDDLAGRLVGNDGADRRVGRGLAQDAVRDAQGEPHQASVLLL